MEPKPLHAPFYSTMSLKSKPGPIYMYWPDKLWHGMGSMNVLRGLVPDFTPQNRKMVDTLPSNIGSTIIEK